MLSGCTIVHTLVPFRMQEVEELCDTDFEFHFDFKVPPDIHPLNELPQDHLLSLNAAARIQVGPGHDLVILLLNGNGRVFQISRFFLGLFQLLCQCRQFAPGVLYHLTEDVRSKTTSPELGVGRMTPMFIQEPFWNLTYSLPQAYYITINPKDALLPQALSQKGWAIKEDIAAVLQDAAAHMSGKEDSSCMI